MNPVVMKKRAMVFGACGQLGVEITRVIQERGFETRLHDKADVDISDTLKVDRTISEFDPSLVFNCAAYNQVDVSESEPLQAVIANGLGVRNLAIACRQNDALLVHFSTDYVFDGTANRPYNEQDTPHPLGAYAVSKYAGELYAQAYLDRVLIARTCGVFGPAGVKTNRGNFIELMLRLEHGRQNIRVIDDHIASPTYAPFLAEKAVELVMRGETGVFHIGGGTPISWYEYARLIFEVAGLQPSLTATTSREYRTAARRPRYSALANARMDALGIPPMPPLRTAIEQYLDHRKDYLL